MARAAPNAIPRDQRRSESTFEIFRPGSRTFQVKDNECIIFYDIYRGYVEEKINKNKRLFDAVSVFCQNSKGHGTMGIENL